MKKILIIEDELPLRNALRDKLIGEGYAVLEAGDGEKGLEMALKEKPDLILLDLIMPKMDGFIMLEKLRLDSWGQDVKVIVLTNLNDNNYVLRSFRNDVYEYVIKTDVKIEDLIKKIKAKLD
jgi:DNA-binding response OmpR family regulator